MTVAMVEGYPIDTTDEFRFDGEEEGARGAGRALSGPLPARRPCRSERATVSTDRWKRRRNRGPLSREVVALPLQGAVPVRRGRTAWSWIRTASASGRSK